MSDAEIFSGEQSVDAHRSTLNPSSNSLLAETVEGKTTAPTNLLSLPTETLLQIIECLSYMDRFRLKMVGNQALLSIQRLTPRPQLQDYIEGYQVISCYQGIYGFSHRGVIATLCLASAIGHHALILKLLDDECRESKVNMPAHSPVEGRRFIHDCLNQAVSYNQVCTVKFLLELCSPNPTRVRHTDWYQYALNDTHTLDYASGNGNNEMLQILFDHGAQVQFRDGYPSPVSLAARNGHESSVRLLVSQLGGNEKELLPPDLSEATANGHLSILKYLLELGVRPRPNPKGMSPLHLAAKGGHLECIKVLLDYDTQDCLANCYDHASHIRYENWSCLHFAVVNGYYKIVKFLLDRGHLAEIPLNSHPTLIPLAAMKGEFQMVKILLASGLNVHGKYNCETSLHLAVTGNFTEIISLLLENGAYASSIEGGSELQTPLHISALKGFSRATSILLASNPDFNIQNLHGQTPLHIAIHNGHILVTELLLQAGATSNLIDNVSQTALSIAIKQGDQVSVSLLLQYNANTDAGFVLGEPALHNACVHDKPNVVFMLLSHGVDVEALDSLGRRPIHVAACHGGFGSLLHLLAANVDRHATSLDGKTALHFAAEAGKQGSVRILLEWGLDRDARDGKGMTPIQYALHTKRFVSHRIVLQLLSNDEDEEEEVWW